MTGKAQPDQVSEAPRRREMARLGDFADVGMVTIARTARVALAPPGPADLVTTIPLRQPGGDSPRPGQAGGGSGRAGRRLLRPQEDPS